MSDTPWTESVTTPPEFETALGELLATAAANDIDVRGSWVYDDSESHDSWEVLVFELE
ncbi:hypothetical protein [Halonotius terrestris]|uniref:hypothetical protein n=1 Tax=Halonotius terrestris TaxID=2487750 RepID=UPI00163D19EE|nr:hypothetical protein [Halonotius terrestris]